MPIVKALRYGQITLPKPLRAALDIKEGDLLEAELDDGRIVLTPKTLVEGDNYSRVGVTLYGVATVPWVRVGDKVYGFGGEPTHGHNKNTENVLQIGTLHRRK